MEINNKLTIIIPCYNCEETLKDAVDSIYAQNIDIPFEIVMVDDGSTDNTKSVMNKLSEKYSEIKIFYHNENKGGGATRNTAVKNSTGNIIFCLDSDDLLPPKTLSKMYKYLLDKKCDGVTIHKSIKFRGKNINDVVYIGVSPYVDKKIPFESIVSNKISFQPLHVNFMYTRESFDKICGYPTTHGYDTQGFAWRFMCNNLNIYTCPNTEYLHRIFFKKTYFLKEYNSGKNNYNWRDIFIENYYIFNKETLDFLLRFDCADFTRDIHTELLKRKSILKENYLDTLGKKHSPLDIKLPHPKYIKRKSIKGLYMRVIKKIKIFYKHG